MKNEAVSSLSETQALCSALFSVLSGNAPIGHTEISSCPYSN